MAINQSEPFLDDESLLEVLSNVWKCETDKYLFDLNQVIAEMEINKVLFSFTIKAKVIGMIYQTKR